jgi:ABC-2 type transport system permease protein
MIAAQQPVTTTAFPVDAGKVSLLRIVLTEARMECLRLLRAPAFSVPTIIFPLLFYVLFGVLLAPAHPNPAIARAILANFMVFGVIAPGLFGVGVTLAMDRDRGLLELKRAMPMPPGAYLTAKLVMAMAFTAIVSLALILTSAMLGRVMLALIQWVALFVLAVLGVLPFCALGLLVGTLTKGQAAAAVINLIYLPMSFLSGLWLPLSTLPKLINEVAPVWPSYHLNALAQALVSGQGGAGQWRHVVILVGMAGLFFFLARRRLPDLS